MDRVQYVHSVDTGNLDYGSAVLMHFDQLMGIYGFIQPCNYQVSIVESNSNYMVLDIKFTDGESALAIANILNSSDKRITVYQRVFTFNIEDCRLDTIRLRLITEV
ncbi:MAG: hypothetical protein NC548_34845 [Lachnospiraceae bacterium]|nr:hypothetical protein [Lachnospiraceae bacterium]